MLITASPVALKFISSQAIIKEGRDVLGIQRIENKTFKQSL